MNVEVRALSKQGKCVCCGCVIEANIEPVFRVPTRSTSDVSVCVGCLCAAYDKAVGYDAIVTKAPVEIRHIATYPIMGD